MIKAGISWLQAPSIIQLYSDKELERMTRRLANAKCDEVWVFSHWDFPDVEPVLPFSRGVLTGLFNIKDINQQYKDNLVRFKKILWNTYVNQLERKAKIHLRFILFDQNGTEKHPWWDVWYHNINGLKGMYDSSQGADNLLKEYWIKPLHELGIKKWGLFNEARCPAEPNVPDINHWTKAYVISKVKYMKDILGTKGLITYSGSEKTRHSIRGWCAHEFGKNTLCEIFHHQMIPENLPTRADMMRGWPYGLHCDGLNIKHSGFPPHRYGECTDSGKYCDSCNADHFKSCKTFQEEIMWRKFYAKFKFAIHLPREIDMSQSPDKLTRASVGFCSGVKRTLGQGG